MFESVGKTMRLALFSTVATYQLTVPVNAYQVDCAILLCLSGGWPASAECTHARAVFIRRITPWPIEPPLQVWRCPMRAVTNSTPGATFGERPLDFAFTGAPLQSLPKSPDMSGGEVSPAVLNRRLDEGSVSAAFLNLAQKISTENGSADIDISGSEFDFVRSIKVWNIMHFSHQPRGENEICSVFHNITLGTYGAQGEYGWAASTPETVPDWAIPSRVCKRGNSVRAVGVEWTDYQGHHGYEVINY